MRTEIPCEAAEGGGGGWYGIDENYIVDIFGGGGSDLVAYKKVVGSR